MSEGTLDGLSRAKELGESPAAIIDAAIAEGAVTSQMRLIHALHQALPGIPLQFCIEAAAYAGFGPEAMDKAKIDEILGPWL